MIYRCLNSARKTLRSKIKMLFFYLSPSSYYKLKDLIKKVKEIKKDFYNIKRNGILAPIRFIVNSEKRVIYLVNGKVANSSIKVSVCDVDAVDDYSIHGITTRKFGYDDLESEHEAYFKFTYVRNPFARLVSCYESKYHTDRDKYNKYGQKSDFAYYLFGFMRKDIGFKGFVKRVSGIPVFLMDKHFCLQQNLIYKQNGECRVDYIGKFEDLPADYNEKIGKRFGLKQLPHFNKSKEVNWMDYYTRKTAELVYRKYKKDFETFGYGDSYKELIKYLAQKKK